MEPQSLKPHSELRDQSAFFQFLTNCVEVKMPGIVFKSYKVLKMENVVTYTGNRFLSYLMIFQSSATPLVLFTLKNH